MSTPTRIYIARPRAEGAKPRLIRAPNVAQAARHFVRTSVDIDVAGQEDIVNALSDGVTVESGAAEPADPS